MAVDDHPIKQPIKMVLMPFNVDGNPFAYIVGKHGVTRIEATSKDGQFCTIPYIRVWSGESCLAELCQHSAEYIEFEQPKN